LLNPFFQCNAKQKFVEIFLDVAFLLYIFIIQSHNPCQQKNENNAIEKNLQAKEKVTVPTILLPSTSFKSDAEHTNK
jgi:hypothetical protein